MSDRQERIWRCDCGDDHFLSITNYGTDDGILSLADGTHCRSLWCRAKAAWSVLRGGSGYAHYGLEVLLDTDTAMAVRDELENHWFPKEPP